MPTTDHPPQPERTTEEDEAVVLRCFFLCGVYDTFYRDERRRDN